MVGLSVGWFIGWLIYYRDANMDDLGVAAADLKHSSSAMRRPENNTLFNQFCACIDGINTFLVFGLFHVSPFTLIFE